MRRLSVVIVMLWALTGCGSQVGTAPTAPSPTPSVLAPSVSTSQPSERATQCPSDVSGQYNGGPSSELLPLPAATVVAAVQCSVDARPVAGDGVWSYLVEQRVDSGPALDRLVAAMRAKDEPTQVGQSCTMELLVLPWIALVDASGHWLRPRIPTDSCGKPQLNVVAAIDALRWTVVSATKGTQLTTQAQAEKDNAAAAAQCATPFKDMIAIEEADRPMTSGDAAWQNIGLQGATICHYRASIDESGMPALNFETGGRVSGDQVLSIASALAATGPVVACRERHTLVTLINTSGGSWYLIENDGCHRILDGNNSAWGQATPELLAVLG